MGTCNRIKHLTVFDSWCAANTPNGISVDDMQHPSVNKNCQEMGVSQLYLIAHIQCNWAQTVTVFNHWHAMAFGGVGQKKNSWLLSFWMDWKFHSLILPNFELSSVEILYFRVKRNYGKLLCGCWQQWWWVGRIAACCRCLRPPTLLCTWEASEDNSWDLKQCWRRGKIERKLLCWPCSHQCPLPNYEGDAIANHMGFTCCWKCWWLWLPNHNPPT